MNKMSNKTIKLIFAFSGLAICLPVYAGKPYDSHSGSSEVSEKSDSTNEQQDGAGEWRPTGTGDREFVKNGALIKSLATTPPTMIYHGGSVMSGTPNVYYIWYGDWNVSNPGAKPVLEQLISDLNGSSYYTINTSYNVTGAPSISNSVNFGKSIDVGYANNVTIRNRKSLLLRDISAIVSKAIDQTASSHLPIDENGLYVLLTSKNVTVSDSNALGGSFCNNFCGFHTYGTITYANSTTKNIKYAFVGDTEACPTACAPKINSTTSPNQNVAADGMASVIAHELVEAVTDPNQNAWYDSTGYENADKCAWNFGIINTASNGSLYNLTLNSRNYLLQQNWLYQGTTTSSANGVCALSL